MTYYTEEITRMPFKALWAAVMGQLFFPFNLLVFGFFAFRKLIGWKFQPVYGTAYPEKIKIVAEDDLPPGVRKDFLHYRDTCEDHGYHFQFFAQQRTVGTKRSFAMFCLHESGRYYSTTLWMKMTVAEQTTRQIVFSCHAFEKNGTRWETGSMDQNSARIAPYILPEGFEVDILVDAEPEEVIQLHRKNLRDADVELLTAENLPGIILQHSQSLYDWMIDKGYFVELSNRDVQRLSN